MPRQRAQEARAPRAGSRPATSGVPVAGANAGSITSMSKLKERRPVADALADALRVLGRASSARSSSHADHSKPHLARLVEVARGVQRPAHAGQQRALRAEQRPPRPRAGTACRGSSARRSTRPMCRRGRRAARAPTGPWRAAWARSSPSTIEWSPPSTIGTTPAATSRREPVGDLAAVRSALPGVTSRSPPVDDRRAREHVDVERRVPRPQQRSSRRGSPRARSGRRAGSSSRCRTGRRRRRRRRRPGR